MAWLAADASFDPDCLAAPVVGIAALLGDHDSGLHRHQRGQLLFTRQGCTRITLDNQLCLLPPSRAAWIPCGVPHRAVMHKTVDYRSLYVSPALAEQLPNQVRVIEVSTLLHAVLEPMAMAPYETDWHSGRYAHLLALCLDEIQAAAEQPMLLPLPQDKRLAPLLADLETLPPTLQDLEKQIGASTKTIGRIFLRETGLGYQQWRQQWRLMLSLIHI